MRRFSCIAAALAVLVTSPAVAEPTWQKFHQTVSASPGGAIIAEFTTIGIYRTNASSFPWEQRVLYKDDSNRRLVIRHAAASDTAFTASVQCVGSGETVTFETVFEQSITMRFGSGSLVLNLSDVDKSASRLPQSMTSQAAALIAPMSAECKSTLSRLVTIGTVYSTALFSDADTLGQILFPNVMIVVPALDTTSNESNLVRPFVPNQTPPDAFEQPFGEAYYQ